MIRQVSMFLSDTINFTAHLLKDFLEISLHLPPSVFFFKTKTLDVNDSKTLVDSKQLYNLTL